MKHSYPEEEDSSEPNLLAQRQSLTGRILSNPLPVLFALGAVSALGFGLKSFVSGNRAQSSLSMGGRVLFQFGALSLIGGTAVYQGIRKTYLQPVKAKEL